MKPRLAAIFAGIVLAPLGLLVWIGIDGVRREHEVARTRTGELYAGRLDEAAGGIRDLLEERERDLLRSSESLPADPGAIREWLSRTPLASAAFVLGPDRKRIHPPPAGPLSPGEARFLERAGEVWRDVGLFYRQSEEAAGSLGPAPRSGPTTSRGWYAWFWGSGIHLLLWERRDGGLVYGLELDRARLLSDVVARLLPDGTESSGPVGSRIRLVDARGETLCSWGPREPAAGEPPAATLYLDVPLSAWRLEYFHDPATSAGGAWDLATRMVAGLSAAGLILAGLAAYFWRESSRDLREAARRVSCVDQVSHELKGPLTNIRLYAEILQEKMKESDPSATRSIDIIVSESQRLSRLITNILTFSRSRSGKLVLHPRPGVIDETIRAVLGRWTPALSAKGLEISFSAGAPREASFDPDTIEGILGNLLSNAEKYAAGSGPLEVASSQEAGITRIIVADRGPGIPWRDREDVFRPFRRLDERLTAGVSGSGLGLPIARDLARLHGGDVRLLPSERGARFEVTLDSPEAGP